MSGVFGASVGAGIGFAFAGPVGIFIGALGGAAASYAMASMMPRAMPQRIGDISKQTAKEGDPRVIIYGCVRPIAPNVIHCQEPVKKMVKQSSSGGGKGGSKKQEQKVEHVFRTYALGVCEGPITAFRRIWRNNKLVYDGRGTPWGEKNNKVFLKSFRLYTGAWDQMPDSKLESIWGVGQVPAYRGTAYMVAIDEDLTDFRGAIPQWLFEVERAQGTYLTSRPYNVEDVEGINLDGAGIISGTYRATIINQSATESLDLSGASITGGMFRSPLIDISADNESVNLAGASITGGTFYASGPFVYNAGFEAVDLSGLLITGGTFRRAIINYTVPDAEAINLAGAEITGGTFNES